MIIEKSYEVLQSQKMQTSSILMNLRNMEDEMCRGIGFLDNTPIPQEMYHYDKGRDCFYWNEEVALPPHGFIEYLKTIHEEEQEDIVFLPKVAAQLRLDSLCESLPKTHRDPIDAIKEPEYVTKRKHFFNIDRDFDESFYCTETQLEAMVDEES